MSKKIAITICATKGYAYAVRTQAVAIQSSILEYCRVRKLENLELFIILVSDGCEKMIKLCSLYEQLFGETDIKLQIKHIIFKDIDDDNKGYKSEAQKIIARLRTAAFINAKKINPDYCWSLDSDVIPKANALICMEDAILFDNEYYSVACCNYPSQGGGFFLCGRGTMHQPILKDIYPDEKRVNQKVTKRIKELTKKKEKLLTNLKGKNVKEHYLKELKIISHKIELWNKYVEKRAVPISNNVFELNSKGWKKRGWFDFAYPAIGKGSMVPTDWCGFGCNLINKKALNYIDFHGYEGKGTEDLFIVWNRWFPNGIKLVALPHCPADHVIRERHTKNMKPSEFKKYSYILTFHEPYGEFEGHLRQQKKEFIEFH